MTAKHFFHVIGTIAAESSIRQPSAQHLDILARFTNIEGIPNPYTTPFKYDLSISGLDNIHNIENLVNQPDPSMRMVLAMNSLYTHGM